MRVWLSIIASLLVCGCVVEKVESPDLPADMGTLQSRIEDYKKEFPELERTRNCYLSDSGDFLSINCTYICRDILDYFPEGQVVTKLALTQTGLECVGTTDSLRYLPESNGSTAQIIDNERICDKYGCEELELGYPNFKPIKKSRDVVVYDRRFA